MAFCANCGNRIEEGMAFCTQCGHAVEINTANGTSPLPQMYEEFVPTWGVGKRFIITENSLIFGNEEYTYSKLSRIELNV